MHQIYMKTHSEEQKRKPLQSDIGRFQVIIKDIRLHNEWSPIGELDRN